jgi:predicted RNA methylase
MNVGLKRNNNEKYYTKKEVVKLCIDEIDKLKIVNDKDLIIEPSCGNGAFIEDIKKLSSDFLFIDIEPENEEITKSDYLEFKINKDVTTKIHIIGNPPFGRQSSLANKFIKKSCEFCDTISFILPKSFKKDSMKKVFPLNFHLISEMDLPKESFLVDEKSYDVPCIFQVWIKKDFNRDIIEKIIPVNYTFVKQNETPDISFRRVGVNAGLISKEIDKSPQSHYFIRFTNDKSIDKIIEKLSNVNFNFNNTVGPKSISKQELISEFNKYLNS